MSAAQKRKPGCALTQAGPLTKGRRESFMADQILHKDMLREKFADAAKTHGEIEAFELVSRHFCIDAALLARVVMTEPAKNAFSPGFAIVAPTSAKERGYATSSRKQSTRMQAKLDRDGPSMPITTAMRDAAKVRNLNILKVGPI